MDLKKVIKDYLANARVMQLATSVNNQPWLCNIHFFADDDCNIYWISTPTRRHSEEIKQNPKVAIAIKVHEDTLEEPYVIGLTAEGEAQMITDNKIQAVGEQYISKLGKKPSLLEDILSEKNPHRFYRMKVTKFVLFDTNLFPAEPRQELEL